MKTSIQTVPVGPIGKLQNDIAIPYDFTVSSVIIESWKRVKGVKATYWSALLLYVLIYFTIIITGLIATYFIAGSLDSNLTTVKMSNAITRILATLLTFPLPFGICLMAVRRSINLPIKAKQMFEAYPSYWKILGTLLILYMIIFLIAFLTIFSVEFVSAIVVKTHSVTPSWLPNITTLISVLGGLTGIYFLFAFSYAPLLVLEKRLSIFRAVKTSFQAFKQHGLKIIFTFFLLALIYLVSIIPFGIGLIWTQPMLFNCSGLFYRILFGVEENVS